MFRKLGNILVRSPLNELKHSKKLKTDQQSGVTTTKRPVPIVISLTTIPERLHQIPLCLSTLLSQTVKPDHIVLWLSETVTVIPDELKKLEARGLSIKFCRDIRSYTKLLYTLKEFPDAIIVTADDDWYYPDNWLEKLVNSYQKNPEYIHCHRAHEMKFNSDGSLRPYKKWNWLAKGVVSPSHLLFPTGAGGVLYPPGTLPQETFNESVFSTICPTADDVWFRAMSLLSGTCVKTVAPNFKEYPKVRGSQKIKLGAINCTRNDEQIEAVFTKYDLYKRLEN